MRCRIFTVPLDSEAALDCERTMDGFMDANNVKRIFASLATQPEGPVWSVLFFYEGAAPAARPAGTSSLVAAGCDRPPSNHAMDSGSSLSGAEVKSIIALKKWRAEAAAQEGVPLYMVAQNRWLEEIVRIPVKTLDDLKKVPGFSEWRVQKYGPKIVEIMGTATAARRSWPTSSSYSAGRA
jgi:superfamily II DNA helicase RecQ